jgi:hypothetical protein
MVTLTYDVAAVFKYRQVSTLDKQKLNLSSVETCPPRCCDFSLALEMAKKTFCSDPIKPYHLDQITLCHLDQITHVISTKLLMSSRPKGEIPQFTTRVFEISPAFGRDDKERSR